MVLGILLAVSLTAAGCGSREVPVTYSNLTEESIRYDLDSLLKEAKVADSRRAQLFDHVDQFNEIVNPALLTEGFQQVGTPKYDVYALQDDWMEAYPDFLGYNCRITSFSLYGENLSFRQDGKPESGELLEFDLAALEEDPRAFPGETEQFKRLFTPVVTEDTKDVKIHAEKVRRAWEDRGIGFRNNDKISIINVFYHEQDGEQNYLHVAHSGVLLPTPDGELWFLEKLAFMEPYQLVQFSDRRQLKAYLMEKYDLDQGQPTAKPFILENDTLL